MTVAPADPSAADAAFGSLGRLADALGLPERSMGMSGDLEAAVAAGVHDGAGGPGPVRRATAGQGRVVVPPAPTSRHYAVPGQEKVWHPRS